MAFIKKNSIFKVAMVLVVTALIMGAVQFAPGIGVAAAGDLDIYLDGIWAESYTYEELAGFEPHQHTFSGLNTYPDTKDYVARGPELEEVLMAAGVMNNAKTLTFISSDGFKRTFTVDELINVLRISSYESDPVPTILALLSASGTDPGQMTPDSRIHLMMGQRTLSEQTNVWQVKNVNRIDVSTTPPGPWTKPTAEISGNQVTLHHPDADLTKKDNFGVKIYYTLNDGDPNIESTMFNVSAWVLPNPPIELNPGTNIIKAIVIGPGHTNSDIATFTYTVR